MLGDTMTSARKPEIADRAAAVAAPQPMETMRLLCLL